MSGSTARSVEFVVDERVPAQQSRRPDLRLRGHRRGAAARPPPRVPRHAALLGWDPQPAQRRGFRTVVPYLRGYHPETVVPGRGYGAATTAADALRLLDSLGEQCAVLIGHDWGASIAYAVAHLHPERARAIVPIAIPPPHLLRPTPGLLFRTRHFLALRVP